MNGMHGWKVSLSTWLGSEGLITVGMVPFLLDSPSAAILLAILGLGSLYWQLKELDLPGPS